MYFVEKVARICPTNENVRTVPSSKLINQKTYTALFVSIILLQYLKF
jgi:hypothetical protein